MSRPTVGDAIDRATVILRPRMWVGVLIFVDEEKGRAKVRLKSGDVVFASLDDLEVRTPVPLVTNDEDARAALHHPQAV